MADLKIQGEVVVDASQAESALDRVGSKAESMAAEVGQSAGQAGRAVDGIGDKADAGAQKFTRAEARMRDAIRKSTLELQQFGKTASEKLEFKLADKGLDASKFQPYLAELRKVEAAHQAASGTLDGMGMSARATAAALRGVPAQFTDIVTALQGGQRPLTVLMQQGGQLKDMFGGVGAAARALGGYVLGLINPFTLAAAAVGAIALAYNQGSKEQDAFNRAIITTGNNSGVTAGQLGQYARAISSVAGTQSKAAETLAAFVAEGVRGGAMLEKYAQTAIEWEKATGQSVAKTAEQFASLQKDPLSSVLKLNEGTNFLTDSVYKQIKALDEQGRSADASKVAMDALNTAMESRSKTIEQNLGYIEGAWRGITSAAKKAWDAMLNVGRAETGASQLASLRETLDQRMQRGPINDMPSTRAAWEKGNEGLRKQIDLLAEQERMLRRGAEAESERNKQLAARIEFDKAGEQYLSKRARMEREIAKATNEAAAAGIGQAELEQRIASIREKFAEKNTEGMKAQRAAAKLLAGDMAELAKMAGLSPDFYKEWDKLNDMFKRGKLDVDGLTKAQAELLKKQPVIAAETKAQADAQKQVNASIDAYRSALQAVAKEEAARVDGIAKSNADLREQIATMGLTNQQIRARTIELNRATIAEKEQQLARLQTGYTNTREQAALEEEIRLLKERNGLLSDQGVKEQYVAAQQEMTDTWTSIDRTAHDVFVNIFEDGAGTFKRLGQTLKAALLDMLYQMTVKRWIINIGASMGVTGGIFGAGQAMAGQGGIGGSSALGMAGNLGSSLFGGTSFANAIGVGVGNAMSSMGITDGISGLLATNGAYGTAGGLMGAIGPALPYIGFAAALLSIFSDDIFGGGIDDTGIMGRFGGKKGFTGQTYQDINGGWFGSDSTDTQDLPDQIARPMAEAWKRITESVHGYAEVLGLDASKIKDFTADFKLSFGDTGLEGDALTKAINDKLQEALKTGSNELAQTLIGTWTDTVERETRTVVQPTGGEGDTGWNVSQVTEDVTRRTYTPSEFARDGEQAIDTLTRLATSLQGVNAMFDTLGITLYEASLKGGDMASQLADAAGGLDKLQASSASYFQNFYTGSEQHATALRQVQEQLEKLGIDTIPATRAQFRDLVESLDLTTEEGRKMYAGLLAISEAFAAVTPQLFQGGQTLSDAITQGLLGTYDGENLGAYMAQTVQDGIYNAIAGYFAQQITDIVVSGVVDPIIQAAITGASITGAVSQATIDEMVARANAVAEVATAVLNDPALREALSSIGRAVSSISMPAQRSASSVASYTRAVSESGDAASRAADRVNDAWKSIGDSLMDEVNRIRGVMNESAGQGLDYWQAQFAIAKAQALAGDQDAAKSLAGLSQNLLRAGEGSAGSALELQRLRAQMAQELQDMARYAYGQGGVLPAQPQLPGGATTGGNMWPGIGVGSPLAALFAPPPSAPSDATTGGNMWTGGQLVAPPRVEPPAGASNADVVAELKALHQALEESNRTDTEMQRRMVRVLERMDTLGMPAVRVEA